MSSGERPIGAAKDKQSDTEALCQTPPPARTWRVVAHLHWPRVSVTLLNAMPHLTILSWNGEILRA